MHGHALFRMSANNPDLALTSLPFKHAVFNGIVFPSFINFEPIKKFTLRPDDLVIATYPKSGTTWVQQIVKLIRNNGNDDGVKISDSIPWIDSVNSEFSQCADIASLPSPRALKTHLPYHMTPGGLPHTTTAKYIYIARNPKDVAVSLYYHMRGFTHYNFKGAWDDYIVHYTDGHVPYGSWFDHVLKWWEHKDDRANVLYLKYEDLKKEPREVVTAIAMFMGYDLQPEVIGSIVKQTTFESMKKNDLSNYSWFVDQRDPSEAPFMRKGEVGDWRSHFTAEQSAKIDALYAQKTRGTGLNFDFEL